MSGLLNLLLTLLFIITSPAWSARCPGNANCQTCEVSAYDIYYLHYGIIEDLDLSSIFNESEATIINCKNPSNRSDLTDLTYYADFKHTIKFVTITNINVTTIPYNLFSKASSLEYLDLSRNQISFISYELFKDCNNLTSLNLSSNFLSTESFDSDQAFPGLSRLKYLDLSDNIITSLGKNLLSGLSSLRYLDMSHNNMKIIDSQAFFSLANLKTLDFSHNALTLKVDDIHYSEFGPVSPFHHSQKTLEDINLAYNNINEIFGDWMFAASLKTLNLSHNHLSVVQDTELQFLSNEIYVDLSSNVIKKIKYGGVGISNEDHIGNIVVNIENNPIRCGCELYKMGLFSEIKYPKVNKRFLKSTVDKFKCGQQNEATNSVCKLDHPLENIIGECPSRCSCIVNPENKSILVDCSYRDLEKAPDTIPWFPGSNVEVNLTGNHLTRIPSKNQKGYAHVTALALSHNKISRIPKDIPIDNLKKLYLDNNNLVRIENEVLDLLRTSTKLKNLSLHGNKLKCSCRARNLTILIQILEHKIPELRNVLCHGYDLPIYTINLNRFCASTHYWIVVLCIIICILGVITGIYLVLHFTKKSNHKNRRKTVYEINQPIIQVTTTRMV